MDSQKLPTTSINDTSPLQRNKPLWPYAVCCGIAIPQLITQVYSAYFKLDGFNDSIKELNSLGKIKFPIMCEWVIGLLVAIYLFSFIAYTILPIFKKLPPTISKSHKSAKELIKEDEEQTKKNFIVSFLTGKKNTPLTNKDIALYGFIYTFALTNTALYSYTSFSASHDTFLKQSWCKTHRVALTLAVICTIGAIFKDFSYAIPHTVEGFPHVFNIFEFKALYWDLVEDKTSKYSLPLRRAARIVLGILLIVLAASSIPLSLNIASYSKLPYWLAFSSSIISMVIIYTCTVCSLCNKEIDKLNGKSEENKTEQNEEKQPLSVSIQSAGFIFCSILFYLSCLIPAAGMGFSWEKMLRDKMPLLSFGVLFGVFIGMTALAFIGRILFCNNIKTINAMVETPEKIKNGLETVFLNKDEQLYQIEGIPAVKSIVKN